MLMESLSRLIQSPGREQAWEVLPSALPLERRNEYE